MKSMLLSVTSALILFASTVFAGVNVTSGLSHERVVKPGEHIEGQITLKNGDKDRSADVKIYKTDYTFNASGETFYPEPGTLPRSNSRWITVTPSALTIPPKGLAAVDYSIDVPSDPDLKGTYWSIIMIEPTDSFTASLANRHSDGKLALTTIVRFGVQMVTDVGNSTVPQLKFLNSKIVRVKDITALEIDLADSGEKWLSPVVWAEFYTKDGQQAGRFESEKKRIYPDSSVKHLLDISSVPRGDYRVLIIVDNGDENVFGAEYDLKIE